jgi:hypothetical protein
MHERVRERALRVMDELMSHPITSIFHNPVDPDHAPEGYFSRVRNPRDLKDICHLLTTSKFASISDWADDVELVWRNCEDFYAPGTYWRAAAQLSRKLFQKLRPQVEDKTVKVWCAEITRLRTKETRLIAKCPARIHGVACDLPDFKLYEQQEAIDYFSDKDIQNFLEGWKLTSEANRERMLRILKETQPALNVGEHARGELWVDVTRLNVSTFVALRDFMRTALEKQGAKYPL